MTIKDKIIEELKKEPKGLAFHQIATRVGVSRVTISKWLAVMEAEGSINIEDFATAKIVTWRG